MIVALLVLILMALLFPGFLRWLLSLIALLFVGTILFGAAHAQAEPLKIEAEKRPISYGGDMWDVIVTSREDSVNITHMELNRGNCHAGFMQKVSRPSFHLSFGQQVQLRMFDCNPIELRIVATEGETTLTFGP